MSPLRASISRHRPDGTLPLINIVLLLILAFMIAGTVAAPLPEEFDPLQSMRGEPEPRANDRVSAVITLSGDVHLDGHAATATDVETALKDLAGSGGGLSLKADSRAPAAAVLKLLMDAEAVGIKNAVVVTVGVKQ